MLWWPYDLIHWDWYCADILIESMVNIDASSRGFTLKLSPHVKTCFRNRSWYFNCDCWAFTLLVEFWHEKVPNGASPIVHHYCDFSGRLALSWPTLMDTDAATTTSSTTTFATSIQLLLLQLLQLILLLQPILYSLFYFCGPCTQLTNIDGHRTQMVQPFCLIHSCLSNNF